MKFLPWLVAAAVPVFYLYFYTPFGMDTTDFGYFYAYAWRILEGQFPYRDFSYIKPALPLYWHAFWLWLTPEQWQIIGGKAGFCISMLASSWFGALFLQKIFNFKKLGISLPLLATAGFIFGVHSFPHMPWHTVDGVLFSSSALFAAISGWPLVAGALAAAATLCKQSFAFVPLAMALMILAWRPQKRETAIFVLGFILLAGAALIWIYANGAWQQFRAMTTGQLDIREALDAGILIYLRQNWIIPLCAAVPWLLWLPLKKKFSQKKFPGWLLPCYCYIVILGIWYVAQMEIEKNWTGYGTSWPTLFMLIGGVFVLFPKIFLLRFSNFPGNSHKAYAASIGLAAALVASWSVAISGGYKIPAFFATPLIFCFFTAQAIFGGNVQKLAWLTIATGLLMFAAGYSYPYVFPQRPLARSQLVYDAGEVYPRASGVMVDEDMLERLKELKYLRHKYGPDYKTLPGFSFAYHLNGDRPVYGSDWLIDWEINGEVDRLYQELLDKGLTVFMERDQLAAERADNYERAGYGVPQRVRKFWRIVEETPHFVVFRPPQPMEKN